MSSSWCHVACAPPRTPAAQAKDAYTLGRPRRPSCHAMRRPEHRWGAGQAPRSPGAGDGSARASPVRLRRVLDPLRCARWAAAPLEGGPPERCDERLVAMGRLSHACLLHTTLGGCRTPPLHSIVPRSFPAGTAPLIAAPRCARQGARGPPTLPAGMQRQPRRPRWLWPSPSTCCVSKGGPRDVAARWASPHVAGDGGPGWRRAGHHQSSGNHPQSAQPPSRSPCHVVRLRRGVSRPVGPDGGHGRDRAYTRSHGTARG
jgi:hypothetical protein